MTAQVSNKSANNFKTNYFVKIKSNIKLMIILLILHMVSAPLNIINLMFYASVSEKRLIAEELGQIVADNSFPNFNYLYPVIGFVATGAALVIGMIVALTMFNYLYKKSRVDMIYSLPMTTNQRFFSDFLGGLTVYLAPFVASSVISIILTLISSAAFPRTMKHMGEVIVGSGINVIQLLLYVIAAGFIIMLMLYTLTVLVMTCCGSLFESAAYTMLINVLIPSSIAAFSLILLGGLYGVNLESIAVPTILRTSPAGLLIGLSYWMSDGGNTFIDFIRIFGIGLIITALMFAGAWVLYYKRKAEQVSKPFVYKTFYYIVITAVTFCLGCLFTDSSGENIIPLIIFSGIVYLIFEVITNRGFKKFYMSAIRYGITITAILMMIFICKTTEGFGMVYIVPNAASVQSVTIDYDGQVLSGTVREDIKLKDKKNIQSVIDMQSAVLKRYKENRREIYDDYEGLMRNYNYQYINLEYKLLNGTKISRNYYLTADEYISLIGIDSSDEFIDGLMGNIKERCEHDYYYVVSLSNKMDSDKFSEKENILNEKRYPKNQALTLDMLLDALSADLKALPDEEIYTPSENTLFMLNIGYYSFAINRNYTNILSLLDKYGVDYSEYDSFDAYDLKETYKMFSIQDSKNSYTGINHNISVSNYELYRDNINYDANQVIFSNRGKEEFLKLLDVGQRYYYTQENCYYLYNEESGIGIIIPPEYSDAAKKLCDGYYITRYTMLGEIID